MVSARRYLATVLGVIALVVMVGFAGAQGKGKGKGQEKGQEKSPAQEKVKGKHHQLAGPQLLGDRIKSNGSHVIHQNGKYTASANVKDGKITGVTVKHSEKGAVPVTKYKTTRKMAMRTWSNGISPASSRGILAQSQYMGTVWIGYGYIDEFGEEYIYWFPYDMIYDGDTGAIEYIPAS